MSEATPDEWQKARGVAILADVGGVLPAVFALREGRGILAWLGGEPIPPTPLTPEERLWLDLRFAELLRRFWPAKALEVVAALPPLAEIDGLSGPGIEVAALIEAGRLEEAAVKLMLTPGDTGQRALLDGRISLERGQLAEAIGAFNQALELATEPELRAEALGFRARTLRLANQDDAAARDFDALEQLCEAHGAGISLGIVRFIRDAAAHQAVPALQAAFYRVGISQLTGPLTLGVEKDRAQVEPIPLHVHGAARKLRQDPPAFVQHLLQIASLQLAVRADVDAFETAWYGFSIGQRLFGQAAVVDLAAFIAGMRDGIGADAYAEVKTTVERRAAEAAARRAGAG